MARSTKLLLIILILACARVQAQCPPNIGFERGSFDNWQLLAGTVNNNGTYNFGTATSLSGSHHLFLREDTTRDIYGHFPVVCPNGSGYSIKLGNETTGKGAERISYTYEIPRGQTMTLILNYAVVLGDPLNNHSDVEQPRFTAKIFNVTDNVSIDCPSFDFIASTGPSFSLSDVSSGAAPNGNPPTNNDRNVRYREWTSTTINLEGYGGKTIRLEFTTNDCTKGGHFGYAYLDVDESSCDAGAISGAEFCPGQSKMTLRGPGGFADYRWYEGPNPTGTLLGVGQSLTLPVPADGTQYTLVIEPYPGLGCRSTLRVTAKQLPLPFIMKVTPLITACANSFVNLKDASVTAGSVDLDFTYHTNPTTLAYLTNPERVTTPGTYYLKGTQKNGGGCTDIMPVEVKFLPRPSIGPLTPKTVQFPGTVDITMPLMAGFTYNYFKDAAGKVPLDNYSAIEVSGTYYVRSTDTGTGCQSNLQPIKVTVGPPAPFVITVPTAFTPNNDGINDLLTIKTTGYLTFDNLKVYNRYGGLVYTTRIMADSWNGNLNGKQLPAGAYYWVFEGMDTYFKTPVRKGGSVALIR